MSITVSSQLFGKLEARVEDLREAMGEDDMEAVQKAVDRISKAFAEVRGTATSVSTPAPASDSEPAKGKKSRKSADGEPKPKRELKPGSWADQLKTTYAPVFNEAWGSEKKPAGLLMKVAGYLKKNGKTEPTLEEMREAITFIRENPEYQSDTQKSRSAANSTDEKPKARGRPKKVVAAEGDASEAPKAADVIAKLEAALSEADDDSDEEEEDEDEETPLVVFEYKGNRYLKDPYQEVYTAEGQMEWLGTFNGKKIVKNGDMPARVKKVIESQD